MIMMKTTSKMIMYGWPSAVVISTTAASAPKLSRSSGSHTWNAGRDGGACADRAVPQRPFHISCRAALRSSASHVRKCRHEAGRKEAIVLAGGAADEAFGKVMQADKTEGAGRKVAEKGDVTEW